MNDVLFSSVRLSLQVALCSTVLVCLLGGAVAYFLATRKFYGKEFAEIVFTLPLVLPPTVTGYYLIVIFGRNGVLGSWLYDLTGWSVMFTWQAAVLASFIVSIPLMVRCSQAAIESVDKTMIETAYTLGYSEFETAMKVILPLAGRGILAGIVLSFARSIGEFGATLMVAGNIPGKTSTMPLAIYSLASSGDWEKAHILVLALTGLSVLFLFMGNRFARRIF